MLLGVPLWISAVIVIVKIKELTLNIEGVCKIEEHFGFIRLYYNSANILVYCIIITRLTSGLSVLHEGHIQLTRAGLIMHDLV
jgi:hypothetical protein